MEDVWRVVRQLAQAIAKWNAEEWAAAAGWATFLVAVIAGSIAWRQVSEARKLREEQAQPYVVAYMEQSPILATAIELVIRNFGATAAHDVVVESEPPLRRTTDDEGGTQDVWIFDCLPLLAPGQEWRTVWDSGLRRFKSDLPDRHELVVRFKDSHGKSLDGKAVLDWSAYRGAHYFRAFGIHHAAKELRKISKEVSTWREGGGRPGLKVFVRDGDARDEETRREYEEWCAEQKAEQEAEQEAREAQPTSPETDEADGAGT